RVEAVGRPSEREPARRVAFEAAAAQVAPRSSRRLRLEQELVVERDRIAHRFLQPLLALPVLRVRRVVVAQRDAGTAGQSFDRFDEVEVLELADERDRVTAALAAEAKIDLLVWADRERRRLLGVERAEAGDAAADALQRDVLTGQRDDVGCLADTLYVLVEDAHRCRLGRGNGRSRPDHTPRGRCSAR